MLEPAILLLSTASRVLAAARVCPLRFEYVTPVQPLDDFFRRKPVIPENVLLILLVIDFSFFAPGDFCGRWTPLVPCAAGLEGGLCAGG